MKANKTTTAQKTNKTKNIKEHIYKNQWNRFRIGMCWHLSAKFIQVASLLTHVQMSF